MEVRRVALSPGEMLLNNNKIASCIMAAMATRRPYLSKSRLISAWQCPKRLHLEKHHPELAEVSAQTESNFATGHLVGDISQNLYGTPESVEIAFDKRMGLMVTKTRELIEGGADFPIFEATFQIRECADTGGRDDSGRRRVARHRGQGVDVGEGLSRTRLCDPGLGAA